VLSEPWMLTDHATFVSDLCKLCMFGRCIMGHHRIFGIISSLPSVQSKCIFASSKASTLFITTIVPCKCLASKLAETTLSIHIYSIKLSDIQFDSAAVLSGKGNTLSLQSFAAQPLLSTSVHASDHIWLISISLYTYTQCVSYLMNVAMAILNTKPHLKHMLKASLKPTVPTEDISYPVIS
jgi:hypothetical protein